MRKILIQLLLNCFPLFLFAQQQYEVKILRNVVDGKIPQYQTVEIGIRLPLQQRMFRQFILDRKSGENPYGQNFLRLQFTCNGKFYNATAFYFEDATPDEKQNKYVTAESEWPWRVRFAVPDTGNWNCNLLVGDPVLMAVPQFSGISFQCIPGKNHGYIVVAPDKKHFQYSDGTSFFAIAQNIAWTDSDILHGLSTWPTVGYSEMYHYINDFADNGGNYVRIVTAPWCTAVQWRETGVYEQDHAAALDSIISIASARGMKIHLCLDLTTGFVSGDSKENQNPIRRDFQKEGMTASDLLRDTNALKAFDQFFRYVYERWAFSPTVATIELMGEQDRWEGYQGRENYFIDFYSRMNDILRNEFGDHKHLLSTSMSKERMKYCSNSVFSFIDIHHYDNDFNCNKKRFAIVNSREVKKLDKPFFFGELGMINGPVNAADAGDYEACNDISMHNAIWSTMFMGCAGIGECWWNWSRDDFRKTNYPAVKFFIDSVGIIPNGNSKEWDGNGLEVFYQTFKYSPTEKCWAVGWVHNESSWWGNMDADCKERNNKKMLPPKDDDKSTVVENRAGNKFIVKGLISNWVYKVTFYDTRIPGKIIVSQKLKSNRFGNLTLKFPANCSDCAFKILLPSTSNVDYYN